jgi:hypothetical protein
MKEFLNRTMHRERAGTSDAVKNFISTFPKITAAIISAFGERPFHVRGPLNSSALDAAFAALIQTKKTLPADLAQRYKKLKEDQTFKETTFFSTSDLSVVKRRFDVARQHLVE